MPLLRLKEKKQLNANLLLLLDNKKYPLGSSQKFPKGYFYFASCKMVILSILTGSTGTELSPCALGSTLAFAILSTISIPSVTCPKTVYSPSREGEPRFLYVSMIFSGVN